MVVDRPGVTHPEYDLHAVLSAVLDSARRSVASGDHALLERVSAVLHGAPVGEVQIDPVTRLGSLAAWEQALNAEAARARRHGRPLSVAKFELDGFDRVLDEDGPCAAERVLRQFAAVVEDLRAGDAAFRIGSATFALLLPETDAPGADVVARRMAAVASDVALGAGRVTVVFGVGGFWGSAPSMIEEADQRLAAARTAVAALRD